VGSGAGFPGLPLKLAAPSLSLTLLDAQGKRVDFLRELTEKLGVEAECLHARAEEQALLPGYREGYDFVLSRAVAKLNVLSELCLPFVKPGGAFLAMKSRDSDEELREAERAIRRLGGAPEEVRELTVAGVPRRVAVIRKEKPTPKGYPRRFAKIKKEPL
jgi:16S rRNA (guanine527-N7)-methyltransferase